MTNYNMTVGVTSAAGEAGEIVFTRSVYELAGLGFLLALVITMTICGNLLVCVTIMTNKRLQNPTNYFVMSLAMTDLLLGVIVLPFSVLLTLSPTWPFGAIFCNIYLSCDVTLCTVSILTLFAISLDRYFAVNKPLRYQQKMSARIVWKSTMGIWLFSIIMAFVPIHLGWNSPTMEVQNHAHPEVCTFELNKGYALLVSVGTYFAPLAIMCVVYTKVLSVAKRQVREINKLTRVGSFKSNTPQKALETETMLNGHGRGSGTSVCVANTDCDERGGCSPSPKAGVKDYLQPPSRHHHRHHVSQPPKQPHDRQKLASDTKATVTLASVVMAFAICWIPYFTLFTAKPFVSKPFNPHVDLFVLWLGYVNSTINPFLYAFYNSSFRHGFIKVLCRCCQERRNNKRIRLALAVRKSRAGSSSETSELSVLKQAMTSW